MKGMHVLLLKNKKKGMRVVANEKLRKQIC